MSDLLLMHSPADVCRWALIRVGVGTDPTASPLGSWPIYASKEPDAPDNVITLYDTAGQDDGRSMVDGELQEHYGIQVRFRAQDEPTGRQKAEAVRKAMAESIYYTNLAVGAYRYLVHCFGPIGNVIGLGEDLRSSKRRLFTVNAMVSLRRVL